MQTLASITWTKASN